MALGSQLFLGGRYRRQGEEARVGGGCGSLYPPYSLNWLDGSILAGCLVCPDGSTKALMADEQREGDGRTKAAVKNISGSSAIICRRQLDPTRPLGPPWVSMLPWKHSTAPYTANRLTACYKLYSSRNVYNTSICSYQ